MSYQSFKNLLNKIQTYNENVADFKKSLQDVNDVYKNNRLTTGKFITDAGGESTGEVRPDGAIYKDDDFDKKDEIAYNKFKKARKSLEKVYTTTAKKTAKNNPLFNILLRGDKLDVNDIKSVYGDSDAFKKAKDDLSRYAGITLDPPLIQKSGQSRKQYNAVYRPSKKNYEGGFSQYDTARKSYTRQMMTDEMKETEETEKMGKEDKDAPKTQKEIDEEDAKKLAADAAAASEEAKAKAKAKAQAEKAKAEQAQVDATLKAQEGGKIEIESEQVQPEQESVKLTEIPKPEDNTVVVEQGRNDLAPDQAMKMSTLDVSKEEKDVDNMPIKEVRKRIEALHTLYENVIKLFQTPGHKKDREQSKKNDSKARKHLKMMLKAVREYYSESSSMNVGVIIPAHQLVASIMSKIGMQMPPAGTTPPQAPPPPPPSPPAQAESKEEEAEPKEETKGDQDEDEEKEDEKPSAPESQKGGVGSVKEHAGDKLKKTGDRFGHGFHVSVNYRNSGMEAYQRRAVGRHVLKSDADDRRGMLADPQPQLNQPALARYIQKIPGFKG